MIEREMYKPLLQLAAQYPVVLLTGPRQSGKTTLCRKAFADKPYVNLEFPDIRQYAIEDPRSFLSDYQDGAVFDEIQRAPELLSYMQGMVDENDQAGRFILTGSQQFEMINTVIQSLAGRVGLLKLLPLSLHELHQHKLKMTLDEHVVSGGYPRIYQKGLSPTRAMADYFETYVQRDIRQLIQIKNIALFEKFVRLCAGRVGQVLNLSSLGADAGVSHATAREWLSLLEASYIVFQLHPWHTNTSKRLIKSPKLYFYDTALAAYLLEIESEKHLRNHPLRGLLFENLVVLEAVKYHSNQGKPCKMSFYRDSAGHEVDLLLHQGNQHLLIEIKSGATVNTDYFKGLKYFAKIFPNAVAAGAVVYGGEMRQRRGDWEVCPWNEMHKLLCTSNGQSGG